MAPDISLDSLWNSSQQTSARLFSWRHTTRVPEPARRFLEHAIAPRTPLASAVRLHMHGKIKLGRWLPFRAEQVIRYDGNMIWTATVSPMEPFGIPLFRGFDQLIEGAGEMRWKLFGLIPAIRATGADMTRSAAGRVQVESVWLPSILCGDDISWNSIDPSHAAATLAVAGVTSPVDFRLDEHGRLLTVRVSRWGNPPPDTKHFRMLDFGGVLEDETTFAGYTIPSRVRVGWYFGSPQFEAIGEFFRATIDDALFR